MANARMKGRDGGGREGGNLGSQSNEGGGGAKYPNTTPFDTPIITHTFHPKTQTRLELCSEHLNLSSFCQTTQGPKQVPPSQIQA